ncbi:MAG TPA: LytTR family DNA-binding domain-containing protein [Flavobacterium sp.]|nr:LytTR family DNA-binding domain-containing protein [Flavobacterium sp.]HPJ11487.1 LytTR family DNA-binding domain-containing protein [Flavobacterium sp.]
MEKYNCIIVEDEPLAAEILKDYIQQVPFLNLIGICEDAIYALDILQKEKINLIFLDINLPKLKGFDFIKTIKNPPNIIITTAYHEFALRGYEHNVIDYLMKPVAFTRFLVAVNKLKQSQEIMPPTLSVKESEREYLFFNVSKKKIKVYIDEILYIESVKEYVNVVTADKSITVKFQLSQVEALLPKNNFIRIHRSYMVAKNKILAFSATDVEINDKQIPIGRSYKELVLAIIEK